MGVSAPSEARAPASLSHLAHGRFDCPARFQAKTPFDGRMLSFTPPFLVIGIRSVRFWHRALGGLISHGQALCRGLDALTGLHFSAAPTSLAEAANSAGPCINGRVASAIWPSAVKYGGVVRNGRGHFLVTYCSSGPARPDTTNLPAVLAPCCAPRGVPGPFSLLLFISGKRSPSTTKPPTTNEAHPRPAELAPTESPHGRKAASRSTGMNALTERPTSEMGSRCSARCAFMTHGACVIRLQATPW